MEEFLQDKIFQFYYHKIYGVKSNYQTFKTFTDKDKVSFLINLYLFISNINKNNNNENKDTKNKEKKNYQNENNIKVNLYQDNYDKIMSEYTKILNQYKKEFRSRPITERIKEVKEPNKNVEYNSAQIQMNNINKKHEKNASYLKDKSIKNFNIDTDNYFEDKKNQEDKEIIINSKRNDIDVNINHKNDFKSGKNNYILNTDSNNKKSNLLISYEYLQNQQPNSKETEKDNIENKCDNNKSMDNNNKEFDLLDISSKSYDKKNNFYINKISKLKLNINNNNNSNLNYELKNEMKSADSRNLLKKKSQYKKDLVLTEQTITERSFIHLEEFTNDNLVEKLIKCPQNKFISLNCSEANQIALVIINLMESKNDLENENEEERKKNEIMLDKLKLDFEKQKSDIKVSYNQKENNVIKILGELEKEISDEKVFLEEEQKGYNLWDHITIENQRTKEIRESIMKKMATFKK